MNCIVSLMCIIGTKVQLGDKPWGWGGGGVVRTHRKERASGEGKRLIHNSKECTLIKGRAGVTEETF